MSVGPITTLTTCELLEAAREREQHPLTRLLLSHLLMASITSPNEDVARSSVYSLLGLVQDMCSELWDDLARWHPHLPPDPQEQAQLWQEARAALVQQWGYADVTARVRAWYACQAQQTGQPFRFDYRLVLQSAETIHYIQTLTDLLMVLDAARPTTGQEEVQQENETNTNREEEDSDAPRL